MTIKNQVEIVDLAQRSIVWLLQVQPDTLLDWFSILIGLYLCEALSGTKGHSGVEKVAQSLANYLESYHVDFDPEVYAITQLLLVYNILYSYDLPAGSLLEIATDTTNSLLEISQPLPQDYSIVQLLLYRVKLFPVFPQPGSLKAEDIGEGVLDIFLADKQKLYQICNQISLATLGGTVTSVDSEQTINNLCQALLPIAVQNLRTYDLNFGCMLLRTLNYLSCENNQLTESTLRFLEFQQRLDGAFGYFTSPASKQLYLATTLCCLWTVAEFRLSRFRLFA